jgi:hypothetical protein
VKDEVTIDKFIADEKKMHKNSSMQKLINV